MPPKTKKGQSQNNNNTSSSGAATPALSAFSTNTFNEIASADFSSLPASDITILTTMQNAFSKAPQLPNNRTPNYVDKASIKHAQIAYDPDTSTATILDMEGKLIKTKKYKESDPIAFILADQAMPGNLKPTAAARRHRFQDEIKNEDVLEDAKGNLHIICPAHGGVVKIESSQTDHADPAKDILKRQCKLIKELNENQILADFFVKQFNLEELFVKINNSYQGTLYFYERYYNDIDNLWNICQSCNLHKKDKDPLLWFSKSDMFGQAFISHLTILGLNDKGLIKTAGGLGLAEIAITWYREKHEDFIKTTKKLYKDVIFKIQENLQKAAKAVTEGNSEKADAYNAQASLTTSLTSMTAGINFRIIAEGVTPPISPDKSQSTSDEDIELLVTKAKYLKEISDEISEDKSATKKEFSRLLKDNVRRKVKQHNTTLPNPSDNAITTTNDSLFKHHSELANYHKEKFEFHQQMANKYNPNEQPDLKKTDEISNLNIIAPNNNQDQTVDTAIDASASNSNKRKLAPTPNVSSNKNEKIIYGGQPRLFKLAKQNPTISNQTTNNTNPISTIEISSTNKSSNTSDDAQMNTNNNSSNMNDSINMDTTDNNNSTHSSPRCGPGNNK